MWQGKYHVSRISRYARPPQKFPLHEYITSYKASRNNFHSVIISRYEMLAMILKSATFSPILCFIWYLVYIPVMVAWYISVRHIWFWKIRYIAIVRRIDWYFYIWILPPQVSPTSYFQFCFFIDLLFFSGELFDIIFSSHIWAYYAFK